MKKNILTLFTILFVTNFITAQNIGFHDLDLIKSKSKYEIETLLKKNSYSFSANQPKSVQWKSKDDNNLIQFNGKGVLVFLTYNYQSYKRMILELKKTKYKYSGKTQKNGAKVESYEKGKETIFLTSMKNPQNGRQIYSITFI